MLPLLLHDLPNVINNIKEDVYRRAADLSRKGIVMQIRTPRRINDRGGRSIWLAQ